MPRTKERRRHNSLRRAVSRFSSLRLPQPEAIDRSVKCSEDHLVTGNRKPRLVQERADLLPTRIELLSGRAVESGGFAGTECWIRSCALNRPPTASLDCPVNSPPARTNTTPLTITGGSAVIMQNLRLQVELDSYKKRYYGPRADRLQSAADLAQLLLSFSQELDRKPINPEDVPPHSEPQEELRRVKRRKGRRHLANFENLPVTTHVYELNDEQRSCPCCGMERKEIGQEESWQIEHIPGRFERIHHVRKKYACPACETNGDHPQMETAAKPETAIEKGMAGPGLLAYIITSKFAEYTPLYRLEDIFARQGFEISRATQSVWCGDVADLVEPLYQLMAERVRASHVVSTDDTIMPMQSTGKTANARMWVYVGDDDHPYNIFDFTLNRGRDGPKYFLQDYNQVLLADAYGGYNGVVAGNGIIRAGCWAHLRRKIIEAEKIRAERLNQPEMLYDWYPGLSNECSS